METVKYRNTDLLVKTIPKGTLLFRIIKNQEDDLRGVLREDGTRCLTPNYNVYFHPNPFMGTLALEGWYQQQQPKIVVYVLTHDVKVLWLVNPSRYTRRTKNSKSMFIKRCSTVKKGCLPHVGREYDPCMSKTMIEKYPEIVGMVAISIGDMAVMRRKLRTVKNKNNILKYFKPVEDARNVRSIPEIILHPLTRRPSKDVITKEGDVLENNYKVYAQLDRKNIPQLESFMKKHAVYNPDLHMYSLKSQT